MDTIDFNKYDKICGRCRVKKKKRQEAGLTLEGEEVVL
jgi:hypothetical protein